MSVNFHLPKFLKCHIRMIFTLPAVFWKSDVVIEIHIHKAREIFTFHPWDGCLKMSRKFRCTINGSPMIFQSNCLLGNEFLLFPNCGKCNGSLINGTGLSMRYDLLRTLTLLLLLGNLKKGSFKRLWIIS